MTLRNKCAACMHRVAIGREYLYCIHEEQPDECRLKKPSDKCNIDRFKYYKDQ